MNKKQYEIELEKVRRINRERQYKRNIRREKFKFFPKINIETSKVIAVYLLILFNLILIYAGIAMWHFGDLTHLGVIITDIAGQVLTYAIYCMKAYKGKKAEETMKYKRDKYLGSLENILKAGAESTEELDLAQKDTEDSYE